MTNSNCSNSPNHEEIQEILNLSSEEIKEIQEIQNNIDSFCDIGLNVFNDDLETLKLLMYCYQYVYKKLNTNNYEETQLTIYKNLIKQEKILKDRMIFAIKTIETDCNCQLMMYEKYQDPLLLVSKKNTELIKYRVNKYLQRCKKEQYTGYQIMKWISRLLISIQYMIGHEIRISNLDDNKINNSTINSDSDSDSDSDSTSTIDSEFEFKILNKLYY